MRHDEVSNFRLALAPPDARYLTLSFPPCALHLLAAASSTPLTTATHLLSFKRMSRVWLSLRYSLVPWQCSAQSLVGPGAALDLSWCHAATVGGVPTHGAVAEEEATILWMGVMKEIVGAVNCCFRFCIEIGKSDM
jgi:hypothetical protein